MFVRSKFFNFDRYSLFLKEKPNSYANILFTKKNLQSKPFLNQVVGQFDKRNSFTSVLANLKTWDANVEYFLTGTISLSFNTINRRRLKNIFLKVINDKNLWNEIEKMICCNLVEISDSSVYMKSDLLQTNFLSSWLLDIYLSEFNSFLKILSDDYCSKLNIYSFNKLFRKKSLFVDFLPLKLENKLHKHRSLKLFLANEYELLNVSFLNKFLQSQLSLNRFIYFTRYSNYFCLGIIGSKSFSLVLKRKIVSFIKSNLSFDTKNLRLVSPFEDYVYFLGFNISIYNFSDKYSRLKVKIRRVKNYQKRFLSRLNFFNLRMAAAMNNRVRIELFSNLIKAMGFKRRSFSNPMSMKIWTFIFQLESIRSIQYEKVIFSEDQASSFNNEIFSEVKNFDLKNYRKYYIGLYAKKVKLVLKDILETFPFFINKSVLPLDLGLISLFDEFKRKFVFLYESMFVNTLEYDSFSINKSYYSTFLKKSMNLKTINASMLNLNSKAACYKSIRINAPIKYIFEKLRLLGFIHPFKKRPISNSQYLSFNDIFIIKSFGYLANSLLLWFRLWFVVFAHYLYFNMYIQDIEYYCKS